MRYMPYQEVCATHDLDIIAKLYCNKDMVTRSEIQDQLKIITGSTQNKDAVKTAMQMWLEAQKASEFETKQIMNDLTSYTEYLNLIN